RPGELPKRLATLATPQARLSQPSMQSTPISRRVMKRLDQLCPTDDLRDVERRIRVVNPVTDERTAHPRWRAVLCQTDPHFPILGITQAGVERTGQRPCRPPDHDIGAATGDRVVSRQRRDHLLGRERWTAVNDVATIGDIHRPPANPLTIGGPPRRYLPCH